MRLRLSAVFFLLSFSCWPQTLVVHITDAAGKGLSKVPVAIRYNFSENRAAKRGEVVATKTGRSGDAVFPSTHLDVGGFSVLAGGVCDIAKTTPLFLLPQVPSGLDANINPVFSSLPATVSIVVYRRSVGECLRWVLSGGS